MRFRYKYVNHFVDRKTGLPFSYFRRSRGQSAIRLLGIPGSPEFLAAYSAALAGITILTPVEPGASRIQAGTVNAAIVQYLKSTAFSELSPGTQQQRRTILERFREKLGDKTIATMPPTFIKQVLAELPPHAARNWLKSIRSLMTFAVDIGLCPADPTAGIKTKVPKSDGHATWSEEQIAQFESFYAIDSKERLAFALLLYTGQRRGDVIHMGRQHIRDGLMTITQQKATGGRKNGITVKIPIHPELARIIAATPGEHLTFVVTKSGKPYEANDFSEQFAAWRAAAGLPKGLTAHGLRKACLTRLANIGCTPSQIAAISGHLTLKEVAHYTAAYDREKAARDAMAKLAGENIREQK